MWSMAAYLACEIGHNAPMMWSDRLVIKDRQRQQERDRESERGGLFPERNIDLIIFSTRPLALAPFSQRERLNDIDRGEDTG